MISFINKFLESLTDEELYYMKNQLYALEDRRMQLKVAHLSKGLDLLEEEKQLVRDGKKIAANQDPAHEKLARYQLDRGKEHRGGVDKA